MPDEDATRRSQLPRIDSSRPYDDALLENSDENSFGPRIDGLSNSENCLRASGGTNDPWQNSDPMRLKDDGSDDDCDSISVASQHDESDDVSDLGCSIDNLHRHSINLLNATTYADEEYVEIHSKSTQSTSMFINSIFNMPSAPTYADGEYEDDKAEMISKLMSNHSNIVSSSLVKRSNLINRVTWLRHHVPGCVLESLFEPIMCARSRASMKSRLHQKSISSGGHEMKANAKAEYKAHLDPLFPQNSSMTPKRKIDSHGCPPYLVEDTLPLTKVHNGALLFIDISGFTKISQVLDVESLSNAINSYFQMIVNEILSHGGDIIKFAGDALFAEWKVMRHESHRDLDFCVSTAATCAAAIVASCSDYAVPKPLDYATQSTRTRRMSHRNTSIRGSIVPNYFDVNTQSDGKDSADHDSSSRRASPVRDRCRNSQEDGEVSNRGEILDADSSSSRRTSVVRGRHRQSLSSTSSDTPTLNVKCAIGVGHIVGIHVGDNVSRREYFIIGDIVGQVARAESAAGMGQVFASPEAVHKLLRIGDLKGDWDESLKGGQPIMIADRDELFFEVTKGSQMNPIPYDAEKMLRKCEDLNITELQWLKNILSLYVHPVVVNDDNERALTSLKVGSYRERHLVEAELRNVYTCFISPRIDHKLTGDEVIDQKLFRLLNDIMIVTTRELSKVQGHLRQFMLDDKGLVLICTFGLRGSTFPDMIPQRALPFSLAIHRALEEDLGVKITVGATLGKVYCGVVGGLERHEFAVLGSSVNLAARLMASDKNPGILVDKTVRLLTNQLFFKPLPAVEAKGYDEPVPIFELRKQAASRSESEVLQPVKKFVGRARELKEVMRMSKEVVLRGSTSKLLLVTAMSGSGKSTLMVQAVEHARAMIKKMNRRVIITRNVSNEGDSMIPFSFFRVILKGVLSQVQHEDEESQLSISMNGLKSLLSHNEVSRQCVDSKDFSIESQLDSLSIQSQSSRSSAKSIDMTRFCFICQELKLPPELMELVGKSFFGISDWGKNDSSTQLDPLTSTVQIHDIVNFMADVFIRYTMDVDLVLLTLDDVQWIDELSWKVVQTIFERAENVLTLCCSRQPLSNLTMDSKFLSDLHGQYQTEGRYFEISLTPFNEAEVKEMIGAALNADIAKVDDSFSLSVYNTTSGMPHYLSYVLDAIKRNNLTVILENGMIVMKNSTDNESKIFGSVNELLLYRLDALDCSVRSVLHLSAILGTEFNLLDAALAYEEMFEVDESRHYETAAAIRESFDVAILEGIIEEIPLSWTEDEDDEIMEEEANTDASMKSAWRRRTHPLYSGNCRLRFTHDSWKVSLLNVMLDERKREMHEHIAISLEKDLDKEALDQDDFEKQITVFKHWKSSGSFMKASAMALNIGRQLMMLGLNSQAILLYDDVLDILKKLTDEDADMAPHYGGIEASVLDAIVVPELDNLIKLNIAKGKAHLTLSHGVAAGNAYQNALDILHYTPCADDDEFDRSASFPIFSGLFVVLKMGGIKDDAECSYEKNMCKSFVEQARLNGDRIHYGRALAMEAEILGRLGKFEDALEILERIKPIYNIETQHAAICKAYGSDRVAQAFSHSVNFNSALGRTQSALDTCKYIMEEIVPKSDPQNVHNSMCLLYSVIITLKENVLSHRALEAFQERIIAPFDEYFGPGGSTFSKPMFKPILVLLELQVKQDLETVTIEEYTSWALDEENFEKKVEIQEALWATFSASPLALLSEICFSLAKRHRDTTKKKSLIQKAINLMEKSVATTATLVYPNMYAKKKLEIITAFAKEEELQEIYTTGEIYSAMTAQDWSNLGQSKSVLVAASDDRKLMNVRAAAQLEHHLDQLIRSRIPDSKISDTVKIQLNEFVDAISLFYNDVEFHSSSHALHVY